MDIEQLAGRLKPDRTILLLGAGASIPSGAPSGSALARQLSELMSPSPTSQDLSEVAGIFENRLGRRALVEAVRLKLINLQPTGGLLALPSFAWRAIYSTNFDNLVEQSFTASDRPLEVIRSNYDFSAGDPSTSRLFKIHGCMTQDVSYGDKARMVLTEQDYDDYENYRQALFNSLQTDMYASDTLIVGQSLSDSHLRDLCKQVGSLRTEGIPGQVFLLAHDYDEDRAQLFARRGVQVVGGNLDTLIHHLSRTQQSRMGRNTSKVALPPDALPPLLATATIDAQHAANLPPNPSRLFNGAPASYADIRADFTIARAVERRLQQSQDGVRGFFLVLSGAGGVGKTSLARRLLLHRVDEGFACWEHKPDYPLDIDRWMDLEASLRQAGRQGFLLLDDCTRYLSATNRLVDALGRLDRPHLRIVATVNSAQWKTRTKSQYFYSRGTIERLSRLTQSDINELLHLVDRQQAIRKLVELRFLNLSWREKVGRLRDRCNADMYVCLKNIFASDRLDDILLQEFTDLEEGARDVYRHVAALQSMGGRVHRQLIMRLLSLEAGGVATLLGQMDAVVNEYDIDSGQGLYGWATRHDVIARVIATYEYADQSELRSLIERLIDGLNPTLHIEIETARSIATDAMGIGRVADIEEQWRLLRRLIRVVPGERIPRRRLIRSLLNHDRLPEADREIVNFRRDVGSDDIVNRYAAILAMHRAEQTPGIREEHRKAMLTEAQSLAEKCIQKDPRDRYNYRTLADIGQVFVRRYGEVDVLGDAVDRMKAVEDEMGDPEFARERRRLETSLRARTEAREIRKATTAASLDDVDVLER